MGKIRKDSWQEEKTETSGGIYYKQKKKSSRRPVREENERLNVTAASGEAKGELELSLRESNSKGR